MIPDPEAFPVLELSPAELVQEHTGRYDAEAARDRENREALGSAGPWPLRRETRWAAGQWVSLSRARLGPEEPSSSP